MLNKATKKPICIDLCCGAGGLAYGFEQAGFDVVLGVDIDREALLTFRRNIPKANCVSADILYLRKKQILNLLHQNKHHIDGLLASPPCKGFSQSNRRSRTIDNPINSLYLDLMRIVSELQPRWFLIENVWGLEQVAGGFVKNHIIELGNLAGYRVVAKVLNAADYKVPQIRRRIFFIGIRDNVNFEFPEATTSRHISVKEAISDLPSLQNGEKSDIQYYRSWGSCLGDYQVQMRGTRMRTLVSGNLVTCNNKIVRERYKFIPPGGNWRDIPAHLMKNYKDPSRCHTGIYRRLEWNKPSVVISNFRKNMLIHPKEERGLSVREAARLQAFPDSFVFDGCLGSQQQQVADAVPPILAYELAKAIHRMIY